MKLFLNCALALLLLIVEFQSKCAHAIFIWSPAAASTDNKVNGGGASSNPPVCSEDVSNSIVKELIQWINDNGGIVDDRQLVKKDNAKHITSSNHVYATSFIPKGTKLLSLPWNLVLEPKEYEEEVSICDLVKVLHNELEANKEGKSNFGPYMAYLESLADPLLLPGAWSPDGKYLLEQVLGEHLLTQSSIDADYRGWKKTCDRGSTGNERTAAHLVVGYKSPSPSVDGQEDTWYQMIPFYDLYTPREDGQDNTELIQDNEDEVLLLVASRDIQAGEEIHTPLGFGETAGQEREFIHSGKIERRFSFNFQDPNAPDKYKPMDVEFDLDREVVDGETKYNITWVEDLRPHSRAYAEVEKELDRIQQIAALLSNDALYSLHPVADFERKAIEEYTLTLIDVLNALLETKHDARPVTAWTTQDYQVGGVNLGSYNLAGVEEEKEPKEGAEPFELFENFDISDMIVGNENWKDMIEYRRQLDRPSVSFYVDKVARKRWLPKQGIPQAKQFVLQYGFELTENGDEEEEAEALYKLIPDEVDYAAKPSHHSEGVSVWLVSHDTETNVTSFSSTARQLKAVKTFDKMNVATGLTEHLHAQAADEESMILRNVKPGVVLEERWVEVDYFDRAPIEFSAFVIWGRVWVVQMNHVEEEQRYAKTWLKRDGTFIAGKEDDYPKELDYIDFPRIVEIAETLAVNKDMFRVDIFAGLPASSPVLKEDATTEEREAAVEYAVNECEVYPTTSFLWWPQLAQDGARLWVAGYKMGNYRTVPNNEIPKEFLEAGGFLPETP